ncbi:hypothetical protein BGY98DRAFT_932800, partial [Russula aff. rugulosa BPL654]
MTSRVDPPEECCGVCRMFDASGTLRVTRMPSWENIVDASVRWSIPERKEWTYCYSLGGRVGAIAVNAKRIEYQASQPGSGEEKAGKSVRIIRKISDQPNHRSSGPRRPPPFLNDDGDDDDEVPMSAADNGQRDRSSSALASSSVPARAPVAATALPFPIQHPWVIRPNILQYNDKTKTPIPGPGHAATATVPALSMSESESEQSADTTATGSTSMLQFCVEGYVNTPKLSAGRGGELSRACLRMGRA